jgi:hypothetical protein
MIKEAGYGARKDEVKLVLTGTIVEENGTLLFALRGKDMEQQFLLASEIEKAVPTPASLKALGEAKGLVGKPVEIEGWWRAKPADEKDALPTILLRRVVPEPARY